MTGLPVTSTCVFVTDTFTVSTSLIIRTIVVSVRCSFGLIIFHFQCFFVSAVRSLGLLCELIMFPELVRCIILDFLHCQSPFRLPLYFLTVNPFVLCLQSLLVSLG